MVALAIVILTLVLAFFEKPDLFQRPLKIDKLIIVILLIIVAIFSGVKEHQTSLQEDKANSTIDSLQGETKILLQQVDTLRKDNRIATREYSSQLLEYYKYTSALMIENSHKVDTLKKSIVTKETPPTLTVNSYFIDTSNNDRKFTYELRAMGSNAHVLDYYYVIIKHPFNMVDTPAIAMGNSMNFTSIIVPNENLEMSLFLKRNGLPEHFYLAMEFVYKSKGNKVQTPMRKVYEIYNANSVKEVNNEIFYAISLNLREHKIWEKFYDL